MNTPRSIKAALNAGYTFKKVSNYGGKKERVDLQPRFYNAGMKAILSFWVSAKFARKINPEPILNKFINPYS
jgi:hypothetical protein